MARRVNPAAPNRGVSGQNALQALSAAETELKVMPGGNIGTDVMMAHSAKAQVFASAAIAHALLEIGDVLRAAVTESEGGS
jgi:hypothetical protein